MLKSKFALPFMALALVAAKAPPPAPAQPALPIIAPAEIAQDPNNLLKLTLSNGGQVVVPAYGPPITLSRVPRDVAAGGLHDLGGRRIYVSRGIGMERIQAPRLRLFCPPEISVLTLTSGAPPAR